MAQELQDLQGPIAPRRPSPWQSSLLLLLYLLHQQIPHLLLLRCPCLPWHLLHLSPLHLRILVEFFHQGRPWIFFTLETKKIKEWTSFKNYHMHLFNFLGVLHINILHIFLTHSWEESGYFSALGANKGSWLLSKQLPISRRGLESTYSSFTRGRLCRL